MSMLAKITIEEILEFVPARKRPSSSTTTLGLTAEWGSMGNFTIVVIRSDRAGLSWAGVTKRCPTDKVTLDVGLAVAANRAWDAFMGNDPGYCRQHKGPGISKKELRKKIQENTKRLKASLPKVTLDRKTPAVPLKSTSYCPFCNTDPCKLSFTL